MTGDSTSPNAGPCRRSGWTFEGHRAVRLVVNDTDIDAARVPSSSIPLICSRDVLHREAFRHVFRFADPPLVRSRSQVITGGRWVGPSARSESRCVHRIGIDPIGANPGSPPGSPLRFSDRHGRGVRRGRGRRSFHRVRRHAPVCGGREMPVSLAECRACSYPLPTCRPARRRS